VTGVQTCALPIWFFKLKIGDAGELDGLMDENAYKAFTASLE
jgi:glycine cleavage system H protein